MKNYWIKEKILKVLLFILVFIFIIKVSLAYPNQINNMVFGIVKSQYTLLFTDKLESKREDVFNDKYGNITQERTNENIGEIQKSATKENSTNKSENYLLKSKGIIENKGLKDNEIFSNKGKEKTGETK